MWRELDINYKDKVFNITTNIDIYVGAMLKIEGIDYIIILLGINKNGVYENIIVETVEDREKRNRYMRIEEIRYYSLQEIEDMLKMYGFKLSRIETENVKK